MPLPAIIASAGLPALIGARAVVPHVAKRGLPALWSNAKKVFGPFGGRAGASKAASKAGQFSGLSGFMGKALSPLKSPYVHSGLLLAPTLADPKSGLRKDFQKGNYGRALGTIAGTTLGGGLLGKLGGKLGSKLFPRLGIGGLAGGTLGLLGGGIAGGIGGYNAGNIMDALTGSGQAQAMPSLQNIGQGITSLAGNSENLQNTLSNVAGMYAQGKLMDALGFPQADQYTDMQLKNYLGSELLGSGFEQIPNIGLSSGMGSIGQFDQTSNTYADIINNPYKEQIKNDSGMTEISDEDIINFIAKLNDRESDVYDDDGKLKPESIRMLMLVQALQQPTNLPIRNAQTNIQARNAQARMDIQNQLGGKFKTIDPNQLYPTYAQPNVPINTPRMGYAAGGVANLINGGAANGPGTGTSDSIPARLSDGEFVMTAKAVKGAGNGSRAEGVRKMYELMNSLENA
jgi:hypothetical protein|tara:strand:- start:2262 stop:3635 length:1374 start_codon:yes stop_codon:yes gene_type:complete